MVTKTEEKQLTIIKETIKEAEDYISRKNASEPHLVNIINIVEDFLRSNNLICYGGTAINNILPIKKQFYDKGIEIPDYDFFSCNAVRDARKLADIYVSEGYTEVEAKSGVHFGTYKVYVNYIPVADITQLPLQIFNNLLKDSIKVDKITYAAPNFLRMSMYLELSRPYGDVSRWEKVYTRLQLLNSEYKFIDKKKRSKCVYKKNFEIKNKKQCYQINNIYEIIKNALILENVVFFGDYAINMITNNKNSKNSKKYNILTDTFSVISKHPKELSDSIINKLTTYNQYIDIQINEVQAIGEITPSYYNIMLNDVSILKIYKTLGCHNYNKLTLKNGDIIKIATIDTIMSFYLAFLYTNDKNIDLDRISCISQSLFSLINKKGNFNKGLFRRFNINCYGIQHMMSDIRAKKSLMFNKLKQERFKKQPSNEYYEWFLNYSPIKSKMYKHHTKTIKKSNTNNNKKILTKRNNKKVKRTMKRNNKKTMKRNKK
jgi:hypothetical protein